jgi:spoIIIJ-associated protein
MEEQKIKIKEIIETLLSRLGVEGRVDILETVENLRFTIRTQEAGLLIGENGQNLIALNHIAKRITEKTLGNIDTPFSLDVNDYQKQKAEEIKDLARMSAQRVRFFKKEVSLRPMSSYERRIVHSVLTEYPDIITESMGDEPERRVVIKPFIPES